MIFNDKVNINGITLNYIEVLCAKIAVSDAIIKYELSKQNNLSPNKYGITLRTLETKLEQLLEQMEVPHDEF